jgi:predicted SnoaL-like aldol condensation-catalyzing enzyme
MSIKNMNVPFSFPPLFFSGHDPPRETERAQPTSFFGGKPLNNDQESLASNRSEWTGETPVGTIDYGGRELSIRRSDTCITARSAAARRDEEKANMITKTLLDRWILLGAITFIGFVQTARADKALTARNKALVTDFYTAVLIDRDMDAAPRFLRPDYIQHNPNVPTGLKGFMDAFRARFTKPVPMAYKRELLRVVGEDDIVVIYVRQSWTTRDGKARQALGFDMFRVQDGKIAEHWDADG